MSDKKEILFRSPTSKPVRLALESGHITIVGEDWRPLPSVFHSLAYSKGCISNDMQKNHILESESKTVERIKEVEDQKFKVKNAIQEAIDKNDAEFFTSKGKPDSRKLTSVVGFSVTNALRDEVWSKMEEDGAVPPSKED